MSRNQFIQYERTEVIGRTAGRHATSRARDENKLIDLRLRTQREEWAFKPSNMTVILTKDGGTFPAGLVLSVPHEIGRMLLHKRLAAIIEHDVTVDAVIGGELEEAVEVMGLGAV